MKEMSNITKTSVMVPRWSRVKSRIDSMGYRNWTVMTLTFLFVVLGGFSTRAWASATVTFNATNSSFSGSAPYSISQDSVTFSLNVPNWYNGGSGHFYIYTSNTTATIGWTPATGFTISVTGVSLNGQNASEKHWQGLSKKTFTGSSYIRSHTSSDNTEVKISQSTTTTTYPYTTSNTNLFPSGNALGNSAYFKLRAEKGHNDADNDNSYEYQINWATITYTVNPPAPTLKNGSSVTRSQFVEGRSNNTVTLTDYFKPFNSGVSMTYEVKKKNGSGEYVTIDTGYDITSNVFKTAVVGEYQIFANSNATGAFNASAASPALAVTIEEVRPVTISVGSQELYVGGTTSMTITERLNTTKDVVFEYDEDFFDYNESTHVLTAKNDANASFSTIEKSIRVTQEAAGIYAAVDMTINFTIKKNVPTFTWNTREHYYYNETISHFFKSSNTATAISVTSTDAHKQIATIVDSALVVYNKPGTARVTMTQAENYYWAEHTEYRDITPEKVSNHVEFTYTKAMFGEGSTTNSITITKNSNKGMSWDDSKNAVCLGNGERSVFDLASSDYGDKYIDIAFYGIPDTLKFDYAVNQSVATFTGDYNWAVYEKAPGGEWSSRIWDSNRNNETFETNVKVPLKETTRYVRLLYTANFSGFYKNIKIGERKQFETDSTSFDFKTQIKNANVPSKSFKFKHANAGYTVTAASNDSHYKVSLNNSDFYSSIIIPNTGGDRMDSSVVYVKYYPSIAGDVEETHNATITFSDALSNSATVSLTGKTQAKLATTLEYIGSDSYSVNADNIAATSLFQVVDANGAVVASPAITLSSSNTDAINTVSSNTAIDFLCGANNVRITASYAGDETYAAASNSGTFYHDIDVIKLSDAIVWSNVAEDGKIHVWAESDIPNTIASANEAIDAYTSSNSAYVRVSGSKGSFALRARRPGEITLTAHSEGSCTYSTAEDTKTIKVDSCAQDIIWEQNLAGLSTEEDGTISRRITLNAYAVDSNNVATGRVITYSLPANTSFASIENGNELVLTDTGSVVLTASTASDDTIYAQAQASKLVRVRVYGTGCGSEIVDKDQHAVGAYDNNKGKQYGDVTPLPPIDKIYVRVGKYRNAATQTLYIYGYNASGTETELASYGAGSLTTSGDDKVLDDISEDICRIKIKAGGTISKWYSDLRITQKSYLRKSVENISNDHLFVYENVNETIRVSYSDKPLLQYRYTGSNLTLTPTETVNNDCGGYGYYDFVLSGSYSRMGDYHDTIYITTTALDTLRVPVYHRVSTGGSLSFNEADGNWSESGKWSDDMLPRRENDVTISKNVIVTGEVEAYSVTLVSGGSITIMPGSGLTVGAGGITGSTTSNLILKAGTTGDTKGQTGYLRIAPEYTGDMPNASVELYSIGYYDRSNSNKNIAAWQFVGSPIEGGVAKEIYPTTSWIYSWIESTGNWTNQKRTLVMQSFRGYETTQMKSADGQLLIYPGQLALNRDTVIDLDWTDILHGENLLANSFAAPIDITKLVNTDFVNAERTLYLFNTGSLSQYNTHNGATGDDAGQFRTISIGTASDMASLFAGDASIPTIIPSMQGFVVKASATGAKLKLDYNRLVWSADYSEHPNKPLRAPKRNTETNEEEEKPITGSMKMTLEANGSADNVYMLESERYITDFEDGYDAHKMEAGNFNIYTIEDEHKLAIDATSSIIGTRVGVRTGEETAYTMSFSYVDGEQEWSLLDMETSQMIDIANGNTYTFFAEPNAEINGRFMIVERADVPSVATGCDNVSEGAKAHKFVKDDQMYILKNGVLYNVMGTVVK